LLPYGVEFDLQTLNFILFFLHCMFGSIKTGLVVLLQGDTRVVFMSRDAADKEVQALSRACLVVVELEEFVAVPAPL
jgi:hypothetical protein